MSLELSSAGNNKKMQVLNIYLCFWKIHKVFSNAFEGKMSPSIENKYVSI